MNARRQMQLGGAVLLLAAIGIWLRDRHWMQSPGDTLPLALGLPLIALLGGPWKVRPQPAAVVWWITLVGVAIFLFGWVIAMLTPLAIGWSVLLGCWLHRSFEPEPRRGRLVWIALLSFPWLVTDWPQIGWAFRISAADMVAKVFALLAMPVTQVGTSLEVVGMPVEIQAACAGWNLLQLSLLTGLAMATMELRKTSRFALLLVLLPLIAWFANAVRILLLAVAGLSWGTSVASGPLHAPTALLVLIIVLGVTRGLAAVLERPAYVRRTVA